MLPPLYSDPATALPDFLAFAGHARMQLEAHPGWRDWLLQDTVTGSAARRGAGKWEFDWREMAGNKIDFSAGLEALRAVKQREIIRLGLLDFSGFLRLEGVMEQLSDLADFCLEKTLELARASLEKRFGAPPTPFAVISLGKLGGRELNYSSDIDVIFVYGEEGDLAGHITHYEFFTRLGQQLIGAFSGTNPHGGLFRIDLRLRPEGVGGPLTRSLESYENYYAGFGEIWERMALLKARSSAGDEALGYDFLKMRDRFSYPAHLSREILREIASLKGRIEREVVGDGELDLHVKLGTGGIREIEFIVQALQLLHGSRQSYLQRSGTLDALDALRTLDLLPADQVLALKTAYVFWRNIEHRLQMVADLQTHTLPRETAARARIARSLGLAPDDFEREIIRHRTSVREIFSGIFASETPVTPIPPDTGFFSDPAQARQDIEALLPEHLAAGPRTRQTFARFWPLLEAALRHAVDPNRTLTRLVQFVEVYGSRGLLYESLATNPKALELLVTIFDRSAFFSEILRACPELFEEEARGGLLDTEKTGAGYLAEMKHLPEPRSGTVRLHFRGELLRLFVRDSLELAPLAVVQREMSALATACLQLACDEARSVSPLAVIGLGRLGGSELSYGSDLDCLLIGEDVAAAQRIIQFMTERLPGGFLFPMDFRLRPNAEGPVCLPLAAYDDYYRNHAQFWEWQALNRARFIAGDAATGARFLALADEMWRRAAADPQAGTKIDAMRARIEKERGDPHFPQGDFKTGRGGLMDIEFGLQRFMLRRGRREPNLHHALDELSNAHGAEAETWRKGLDFLRRIESVLRCDANSAVW
ncbi:MAG TPA: glutamine-synthetase adenylyltransferase, partial [Candidatus Methylacidiphilales bacterium]|nr:glutamine-synthetase adenylyltransferase [Candidatus Methylacidiphilales bacterium]